MRILCVDDHADNRRVLQQFLESMGYVVIGANNANQALSHLRSSDPVDALITDVIMPGISGIELARQAAEIRPGLPVLLLTGKSDGVEAALASGAIALLKPVQPSRLQHVLNDALTGRQG